jgi:hypothetical protein
MHSRTGRIRRLSADERAVVAAAALLLAFLPALCRLFGPVPWMTGRIQLPLAARERSLSARRIAGLVDAVADSLPWRPSCLTRACGSAMLVRWAGGDACDVVIGVRQLREPFEAHAWIEVAGQPVAPLPAGAWTPIGRWPVSRRSCGR